MYLTQQILQFLPYISLKKSTVQYFNHSFDQKIQTEYIFLESNTVLGFRIEFNLAFGKVVKYTTEIFRLSVSTESADNYGRV